jgi:hypothetical protein
MPSEYAAFAADFYINMRMSLKMDLAMRRDTVLSMFDRIRRQIPGMERLKRYSDELALESRPDGAAVGVTTHGQQWVAVRKTSLRSGSVNPDSTADGYALHKLLVESAPYFLDISPIDVDHLELLWGFDLPASGNHDAIVFSALFADSPLAGLLDGAGGKGGWSARPVECQPTLGVALGDDPLRQAHVEIKTRNHAPTGEGREQPISVYLIVRHHGPFNEVADLVKHLSQISTTGEEILDSWLVSRLLTPLREAIASSE